VTAWGKSDLPKRRQVRSKKKEAPAGKSFQKSKKKVPGSESNSSSNTLQALSKSVEVVEEWRGEIASSRTENLVG